MSPRARFAVVGIAAAAAVGGIVYAAFAAFDGDAAGAVVWAALLAAVATASFGWGKWKAVAWLGAFPWAAGSLLADLAWATGVWDRSGEYEPLPLSMFVIPFGVPAFCAAATLGVAARRAARSRTPREI